jgi:4-alpha-glucanotransferase
MKEFNLAGVEITTLKYNLENSHPAYQAQLTEAKLRLKTKYKNKVIFSSTHDTPPLIAWVKALPPTIRQKMMQANNFPSDLTDHQFATSLRELILQTDARLIVIPWQDWHLDNFRFNVPGREELTNWRYQVEIDKYL